MNRMRNSCTNSGVYSLLFIFLIILAYSNAELILVTSEDYIGMKSTDGRVIFEKEEIAGFKNYNFFSKNNTVNGKSCYQSIGRVDVTNIKNNGISKATEDQNWVLILPFDNTYFVENLKDINTFLKTIKGVIFTYSGNPQITSPAPDYDLPEIISFAKQELINTKDVENLSFPKSESYTITHEHIYTQFCSVMEPSFKYYIAGLGFWGFGTVLHIFWTWCVKKDYSTHLQKIMLFVPIFFFGYTLIDYVYYMSGPWTETSGVQYLQIVQIALVTIFNTLFVGLGGFISKGWSIMRSSFTREELSSITMIVGIFYLVYSAYFIASDIPSLKIVIIVILIIMYVWVAITGLKNGVINIRMLKSHIAITGPEEIILDALKLKKSLMIYFAIITTLYYFNKILYSALYTFITDNSICRNLIIINLFVELIIVMSLLFVFRARKWPEYFSLDILYRQLGNMDDHEALPKSVIMTAVMPSAWTTNNAKMDMVLNGYETNYFKIRNYKDPQVAIILEASEQSPYHMQKMTHQDFRSNIYSEIKLAIEEENNDSSDSD